jgi:hypothetical protein
MWAAGRVLAERLGFDDDRASLVTVGTERMSKRKSQEYPRKIRLKGYRRRD